jgi:hypothetical protein
MWWASHLVRIKFIPQCTVSNSTAHFRVHRIVISYWKRNSEVSGRWLQRDCTGDSITEARCRAAPAPSGSLCRLWLQSVVVVGAHKYTRPVSDGRLLLPHSDLATAHTRSKTGVSELLGVL